MMSSYKRTFWKNSPETEITAEKLNNMEEGIEKLYNNISNPNLLINGNFQVWQRGTQFHYSERQAYKYTADRWAIFSSIGTEFKCDKVDGGLKFSCTYGQNALTQILETKLEAGQDYVLSAMIDGVVYTMNIVGGVYGDSDDNKLGYWDYGSDYERILVKTKSTGSSIVSWVKLEKGKIATPFVPRLYAEELMSCQRYCYKYTVIDNVVYVGIGGTIYIPIPQMSNMRSQKTVLCNNGRVGMTTKDGVIDEYRDYTIGISPETDSEIRIIPSNPKYSSQAMPVELTIPIIIDAEIY